MKRRLVVLVACVLLALAVPAWAVGTLVVTAADQGGQVTRYAMAWTSSAGGAVSGNTLSIKTGYIYQFKFIPSGGGTQPTDLYDVVLNDVGGIDVLLGGGANKSNTTSAATNQVQVVPPIYYDATDGVLDLVISNAGNAKTGTFILWVRP